MSIGICSHKRSNEQHNRTVHTEKKIKAQRMQLTAITQIAGMRNQITIINSFRKTLGK